MLMICLVLAMTSCAVTIIGGMTVRQAFPDERAAKLVEATVRGDYAEADKQLKAGADVNYLGTDGLSPLLWVIYEGHRAHNYRGTEYLLKAGANANYRDSKQKRSAMYFAAAGDSPELLELLLKYKGNPNLLGAFNEPLLHAAVREQRRENIELLLGHGADINILRDGRTAADHAVALGQFDLVALFLEKGLSYDLQGLAKGVEGRHVPLNSDAQHWKDKVITMLKERGIKFPAFVPKKTPKLDLPDKF
jgi:uncharacterized protein